jgi:hypothetical protein
VKWDIGIGFLFTADTLVDRELAFPASTLFIGYAGGHFMAFIKVLDVMFHHLTHAQPSPRVAF